VPLLHLFSRTQPPTSPKSTTEITAFPHPVTSTAHHNHTHKRGRTFHTPLSPVSPSHTHTILTSSSPLHSDPPIPVPHPSNLAKSPSAVVPLQRGREWGKYEQTYTCPTLETNGVMRHTALQEAEEGIRPFFFYLALWRGNATSSVRGLMCPGCGRRVGAEVP
jgi:hypothetical protein